MTINFDHPRWFNENNLKFSENVFVGVGRGMDGNDSKYVHFTAPHINTLMKVSRVSATWL